MSTISTTDLIAIREVITLDNSVKYAMTALAFYEHLVTFKYEIDFLWRRKRNAATWIFIFNRYLLLAKVVFWVVPVDRQCENSQLMNMLIFLVNGELSTFPTYVFSILRIYALLQDHLWKFAVTWFMVVLALAMIIPITYAEFRLKWVYVSDPMLGSSCSQAGFSASPDVIHRIQRLISIDSFHRLAVSMAAVAIGLISAVLTLVIMLAKTSRQVQRTCALGFPTTLSRVLLREGVIFFLIILVQDIVYLALKGVVSNGAAGAIVTTILNVLFLVFLSRFIMNLRQVDSPSSFDVSSNPHPSRFSLPNFRMPTMDEVVGNLGESLDFVEHDLDDEDGAAHDNGAAAGGCQISFVTDPGMADPA